MYDTIILYAMIPYEKISVRGLLKANYVTCKYMNVTHDLNYCVTRSRLLGLAFSHEKPLRKFY